jgi:hypothetical protein
MEFPKTNKKIKYVIVGEVIVDPGEDREIESVLDKIREVGEAEVVDIAIVDDDEEEDDEN